MLTTVVSLGPLIFPMRKLFLVPRLHNLFFIFQLTFKNDFF